MAAIKCYGLHYSLEKVEWDEFEICGWRPNYPNWRAEPDEPEFYLNNQRGVYLLQDERRAPLYIGRAGTGKARLVNRLWAHTRNDNRGRWTHFSWFGLDEPSPYGSSEQNAPSVEHADLSKDPSIENDASAPLYELEAILISAIDPPLNKRAGDWRDAKQILQWSWAENVSLLELDRITRKTKKRVKKLKKLQKPK